jgi:hypothetical protein
VFKSHLWGSPAVVSSDAEVSRAVLQADASSFVPWYPRSLMELMGESSILVLGGGLQRRVHGLSGAFFKSPQLKARLTAGMQRRVAEAMDGWRRRCGDDGGGAVVVRVQDEAKSVRYLRHALTHVVASAKVASTIDTLRACRSIASFGRSDDVQVQPMRAHVRRGLGLRTCVIKVGRNPSVVGRTCAVVVMLSSSAHVCTLTTSSSCVRS